MEMTFEIKVKNGKCNINGVDFDACGDNAMQSLGYMLNSYLYQQSCHLNGTFNKGCYWPIEVQVAIDWTLSKRFTVEPTKHLSERIAEYHLPKNCYTAMLYGEVVEAEFVNGVVTKIITRLPNRMRDNEDICAAIRLKREFRDAAYQYTDVAQVVTVWTNNRNDLHNTLKTENYVQALA